VPVNGFERSLVNKGGKNVIQREFVPQQRMHSIDKYGRQQCSLTMKSHGENNTLKSATSRIVTLMKRKQTRYISRSQKHSRTTKKA